MGRGKFTPIGKFLFVAPVLAFLAISNDAFSQRFSLTPAIGVANYRGDLAVGYTPAYKPAASFGCSWNMSPRYRLRANLSGMSVEGDDAKSPTNGIAERNLNFKTSIWELGLLGEYDLLTPRFNNIVPYVFAGVGVYHFNPKPLKPIDGKDVNLHDIGTEGQNFASGKYADRKYNLTQLNLQFGGGVKFIMSETFSICVEANYRRLFTDYLDNVSAPKYIPYSEWQAEIARNPGAAVAYSYSIGNTPDPIKG